MAVSENPTTQRQYLAALAITAALTQAIQQLWVVTKPLSSPQATDSFRAGMAALVEQLSQAARSVAVDYYADLRREAGVPRTTRALRLVDLPPRSMVDAGIDYAMRAKAEADEMEAAILARAEAAAQKVVADVGRAQVVAAVEGDDAALGFRRVARPDACYWCLALAMRRSTRGTEGEEHLGVYKSRASAGQLPPNAVGAVNRYHNNCHCAVEPVFDLGADTIPAWMGDMERLYETSTATSRRGERLNDFRRALAAERRGTETTTPTPPAAIGALPSNDERLRLLSDILAGLAA